MPSSTSSLPTFELSLRGVDGSDAQLRPRLERVRAWAWPLLASALHVGAILLLERFAPREWALRGYRRRNRPSLLSRSSTRSGRPSDSRPEPEPEEGPIERRAPERAAGYRAPSRSLEQGSAEPENGTSDESPSGDHERLPPPRSKRPRAKKGPRFRSTRLGSARRTRFFAAISRAIAGRGHPPAPVESGATRQAPGGRSAPRRPRAEPRSRGSRADSPRSRDAQR